MIKSASDERQLFARWRNGDGGRLSGVLNFPSPAHNQSVPFDNNLVVNRANVRVGTAHLPPHFFQVIESYTIWERRAAVDEVGCENFVQHVNVALRLLLLRP